MTSVASTLPSGMMAPKDSICSVAADPAAVPSTTATPISPGPTENAPGGPEDEKLLDAEKYFYQRVNRRRVPWRAMVLAVLLSIMGVGFIVAGSLIFAGVYKLERYDKLTPYGLVIFGILCVLPGAYHIHLAIRISAGQRGYSWDDIPDFN